MTKGEKILNIVLFVILIVFFIEAQKISPGFMVESVQREVGADFWPKKLLLILLFLTAILIIQSLFFPSGKDKSISETGEKDRWANWLILLFSIIIYIKIQYVIGFIIASCLLVGFNMYNFGYRKITYLIIFPVGMTFIFVFVFGRFLTVPLPKGISLFRYIGFLFY